MAGDPDPAEGQMWEAVLAFEDLGLSRTDLASRFQDILKNFPTSKYAADARQYADILARMIKEDEERAQRPMKAAADETKDERIADLIFQLRDQHGHQFSQPGKCEIFDDERGEASAAHQLVREGYDAVPQLIAALEDERLTRSVGFHRDFYFSHYVLRVGDGAVAIIERITGRSFYDRKSTSGAMVKDGQAAETKAKVLAWWQEFQAKGERQMLIQGTEAGDRNSPSQADKLVAKYPANALPALRTGIRAAKEDSVRADLIESAAQLNGDPPLPLLFEELQGPFLRSRVAAAKALHVRGQERGVAAMIEEWDRSAAADKEPDGLSWLYEFLASCDRVEAMQALGRNLRRRPVSTRMNVVEALDPNERVFWKVAGPRPPAVEDAAEEVLAGALADAEVRKGEGGSREGKNYSDPRICDMAAHMLVLCWKRPDLFDLEAATPVREQQIKQLSEIWAKSRGKKLPPPPRPPGPGGPN